MVEKREILDLQEKIVFSLAKSAPVNWSTIVLNIQIGESYSHVDPKIDFICSCLCIEGKNGMLDLFPEMLSLVQMLNESFETLKGKKWDACDLSLGKEGHYHFSYYQNSEGRLRCIYDYDATYKFENNNGRDNNNMGTAMMF